MKSNLVLTSEQKKVRFRKKSSEDPSSIKRTEVENQEKVQNDGFNNLNSDTLTELEATLVSSPFQPQIDLSNLALDSELFDFMPMELEVFDQSFKDINMGDEWLKEFVMFSFDVPLSKHFASTTFRTLRQRFHRILQSNPQFRTLNSSDQEQIWRQGSLKAATLWIIKGENLESGQDQLHFLLGQDDLCTWQKYYQFNFPKFQQMTLKKVSLVSDFFDSQDKIKYSDISVKLDTLIDQVFQSMTMYSLYSSVSNTSMSTEAAATFVMKMTSKYFSLLKQKVNDEEKIIHILDLVNDLSNTLSKLSL